MELKNAQVDTLLNDVAQGATTATLTSGNFGTPVGAIYLVFDYDVSAKFEVKRCTVAGASITGMSHVSGANVAHSAGCKVGRMMVAEIIDDIKSGVGFDTGVALPSPVLTTPALGTPASGVLTNCSGLPATGLTTSAITLGYAEITSQYSSSAYTGADVTGLTSTVTVPTGGRRIKITVQIPNAYGSGGADLYLHIQEDGSDIGIFTYGLTAARNTHTLITSKIPSAGSHTYKLQWTASGAVTYTIDSSATERAFILVELI